MKRQTIADIIAALLIFLFFYAALSKLLEFEKFKTQIGQSPLLTSFAVWIAWIIPTIEILISCMLGFKRTRLAGLYFSFGLLVLFTAYIIAITRFSPSIPCSCGGVLEHLTWNQHLVFNMVFIAFALWGLILQLKEQRKLKYL